MRFTMTSAACVLAACSDYGFGKAEDDAPKPEEEETAEPETEDSAGDSAGETADTSEPPIDEEPPGGADAAMYAHTADTLFSVEPTSPYTLTLIGQFRGSDGRPVSDITDLSVDGDGYMYALSYDAVFEVDPTNAQVAPLASHSPITNAMTFLDDGTLLAGADSNLYEVDRTSGTFGASRAIGGWSFAGDMVGLPDGLLYCAMSQGSSTGASYLVVWDPGSGTVIFSGPTGTGAMYGVAYAEDTLFGFTEGGKILTIDPGTGAATQVSSPGVAFYGAATNPWRWD